MGVSFMDVVVAVVVERTMVWLWFDGTLLLFCWLWGVECCVNW